MRALSSMLSCQRSAQQPWQKTKRMLHVTFLCASIHPSLPLPSSGKGGQLFLFDLRAPCAQGNGALYSLDGGQQAGGRCTISAIASRTVETCHGIEMCCCHDVTAAVILPAACCSELAVAMHCICRAAHDNDSSQ